MRDYHLEDDDNEEMLVSTSDTIADAEKRREEIDMISTERRDVLQFHITEMLHGSEGIVNVYCISNS
jgi:hypothetical protein